MNEELTREIAQKLMAIEGEVRGVALKTDAEYVLREKGETGLKAAEAELAAVGYPIKYKEIQTMDFYPVGWRALSLLAIKKALGFDNEKIKEMGLFATKVSLIIKLFVKYFFSTQRVFFKEAPGIWHKHWTVGELEPVELDEQKKYAILRVKGFNLHPIYCYYLRGYFSGIFQMIIKTSQITAEEKKCTLAGDEYHEYLFKWL